MIDYIRPIIKENMNLKFIFSLLFFEHGFLSYYLDYSSEIFYLGPSSYFMAKGVIFCYFFSMQISTFHKIQTKT